MMNLVEMADQDVPLAPIKAAFFDVDGTLLRGDGSLSKPVIAQIQRLKNAGVMVGAATGRPHFATQFLVEQAGLSDFGVFCTGAYVFSPDSGETLLQACIRQSLAQAFLQAARAKQVYYEVYGFEGYCVDHSLFRELTEVHSEHLRVKPSVGEANAWMQQTGVTKFLVAAPAGDHSLAELEVAFGQLDFAYAQFPAFPHWQFASVVDQRACKHRAFDALLARYQIEDSNVMSFGDSPSDAIFLQRAGYGVAMGNASRAIQNTARFVTKTVDEDGVAYAIDRFLSLHNG